MSLDLMMNAAMDIPVNGGSIVHWKFVLISIAYCFGSIFLRGILHSFDENDGNQQPREAVDEWIVNIDPQEDDHHVVQSRGPGGGCEQSGIRDDHNERGETGTIEVGHEQSGIGDDHKEDEGIVSYQDYESGGAGEGRAQGGEGDDHNEGGENGTTWGGREQSGIGDDHKEDEEIVSNQDYESGGGGGGREQNGIRDDHNEGGEMDEWGETGTAGGGREQSGTGDDHNADEGIVFDQDYEFNLPISHQLRKRKGKRSLQPLRLQRRLAEAELQRRLAKEEKEDWLRERSLYG